jgi:hypothetical protein
VSVEKEATAGRIYRPKFASVPEWVANHPHILSHPTALSTYVHLFLLGDFKSRITTSDWREITQATGWSRATVMRAMKVLREAGAAVLEGYDVRLPMDNPASLKCETETGRVSNVRLESLKCETAPYTEVNSEKDTDSDESGAVTDEIPPAKKRAPKTATKPAAPTGKPKLYPLAAALAREWQIDLKTATPAESGQAFKTAKNLANLDQPATPTAVAAVASALRIKWRDDRFPDKWARLTPYAIEKNWSEGSALAGLTEVTEELVTDPDLLRRAAIYHDYADNLEWTDAEGNTRNESPDGCGIAPPAHPDGGPVDRDGRRFKWVMERRVYLSPTRGAQGPASDILQQEVGDSAETVPQSLRNDSSVSPSEADLGN